MSRRGKSRYRTLIAPTPGSTIAPFWSMKNGVQSANEVPSRQSSTNAEETPKKVPTSLAAKKPENIIYGPDETPPFLTGALLGLQHAILLIAGLVVITLFGDAAGLSPEDTAGMASACLLASGIATILQASRHGARFFVAESPGSSYVQAGIMAAQLGGLPLVFGMTCIGGLAQIGLSRLIRRFRAFFPTEIAGLVVAVVGLGMAPYGVKMFFGLGGTDNHATGVEMLTGLVTLAVMIGLSIRPRGRLRLFSILAGMMAGCTVAAAGGLITAEDGRRIMAFPLVAAPPIWNFRLAFAPGLILPFLIAALAASLKCMGDVTACQKINDRNWKRPDTKSITRGIFMEGLATAGAGLIGGLGLSTSSVNVGLSLATGATSRRLAWFQGGFFILLACLPRVNAVFGFLPRPVVGAVIIFAICYMVTTGLTIMLSRMLDARKTFIIGLAIVFGQSVELMPQVFNSAPDWLRPVFSSSMTLSTVLAVTLNLLFRLGVSSRARTVINPFEDFGQTLYEFFERAGSRWSARREVIQRSHAAIHEFIETAVALELVTSPVTLELSFEETELVALLEYTGRPPDFERAAAEPATMDDFDVIAVSLRIIQRSASTWECQEKDGRCRLRLVFEH